MTCVYECVTVCMSCVY
ncbi:hypothetical protein NFI96_028595, partial [Prochilodus magdalenae]